MVSGPRQASEVTEGSNKSVEVQHKEEDQVCCEEAHASAFDLGAAFVKGRQRVDIRGSCEALWPLVRVKPPYQRAENERDAKGAYNIRV